MSADGSVTWREPASIRVASVPAGHPYVERALPHDDDHGSDEAGPSVRVLPDRDPDDPSREAGPRWWPPVALEPTWLRDAELDLLHVHFGYDGHTPEQLAAVVDVLDARGVPLVLTLHDLRNPHHDDPDLLGRQLDVLVPRAAAIVTLTDAAADRIRRRWDREALVLPHPHVVDLDLMAGVRAERRRLAPGPLRVGLAVKELRRSSEPLRLLPGLLDGVRLVPDAQLRVTVHHEVRERAAGGDRRARELTETLDVLALDPDHDDHLRVVWHDRLDDTELADDLAAQDVAVLPYRFGTHSGWLEACHDVGTQVLAPDLGCYAAQGADATYPADEEHVDTAALTEALVDLLGRPGLPLPGLEADERRAQAQRVRDAHRTLYADVLAGVRR